MLHCPLDCSVDIEVLRVLPDGRRELRCEACGHTWVHGQARPDPTTGRLLAVFDVDDRAYLDWIHTWRDGYVLNCERHPRPDYLVLHRARCISISELQPGATTFVGEFIKVCSTDRAVVQQWARDNGRSDATFCQLCM